MARFAGAGFRERAFYPCYGLAESTLFVCGRFGLDVVEPRGGCPAVSLGQGSPETDLRIVDPEPRHMLPEGRVGEIWIRSASVARGYYRDSEATSRCFNQQLEGVAGYCRTGDLGFMRGGTLYFVGRVKNVIKQRGVTFHAEDIEDQVHALLASWHGGQCAACNRPDTGELVLLVEGGDRLASVDRVQLREAIRGELCQAMGLSLGAVGFLRQGGLPRTSSGKLRRGECLRRFLDGSLERLADDRRASRPQPSGASVSSPGGEKRHEQ